MGVGGEKKAMHEIGATRGSAQDDAFEALVDKLESAGAEIERDEITPLYTDIGMEEYELGYQREISFKLNRIEFKLTRKVEEARLAGDGRQKHLVELDVPRVKMSLRRKAGPSEDWQVVDLEDLL